MQKQKSSILLIALIIAMGGFLMGFDASVISGVIKFIEPEFNLSKIELGWSVASLSLAATVAMIFAGLLSDKFGRRLNIQYAAMCCAMNYELFRLKGISKFKHIILKNTLSVYYICANQLR